MTKQIARTLSSPAGGNNAPVSERRKDERVSGALKVLVKCALEDDFTEMRAHDLSSGGVFIASQAPLAVGTLMKIDRSESMGIEGVGRVVWVRPSERSSHGKPAGMGVKFVRLSDRTKNELEQLMASLAARPFDGDARWLAEDLQHQAQPHRTQDSGVRALAPQLHSVASDVLYALASASSDAEPSEPFDSEPAEPSDAEPTEPGLKGMSGPKAGAASSGRVPSAMATPNREMLLSQQSAAAILKGVLAAAAVVALCGLWATLDDPEPASRPAPRVPATASATLGTESATRGTVTVAVMTQPEGAEIFVGESARGRAPVRLELQAGAPVTLRARAPGHVESRLEWTPTAAPEPLRLVLEPLPYVLHVESDPPGAWLIVNGEKARAPADIALPSFDGKRVALAVGLFGYAEKSLYVSPSDFVEGEGVMRAEIKVTLRRGRQTAASAASTPTAEPAPPSEAPTEPAPVAADEPAPIEP